ncbi:MAG: hypothetical protein LBB58_05395 [Cellulomonadaceae bacterium]|nr:hypothetical protein [Cellulomonadaceae bacterium]
MSLDETRTAAVHFAGCASAHAFCHQDAAIRKWLAYSIENGATVYVSSLTLAEVVTGGSRDVNLNRVLKAMVTVQVSDGIARSAGVLRVAARDSRRKARDLTVDAIVAATALILPKPVIVLTGDPHDIRLLLGDSEIAVSSV